MSETAEKGGPAAAAAEPAKPAAAAADPTAIPEGFKVLQEGKARILQKGNDVFYNEAQVTNRDLSIAVIRRFLRMRDAEIKSGALKRGKGPAGPGPKESGPRPKGPRLLEGLAATGLRSIRYALEIPELGSIDANDLDAGAAAAMGRNVALNAAQGEEQRAACAKIRTLCSDARLTMLQNPGAYDVVDLDPYGTPANLLDSAVQAVSEGGLLCVTATDMANLCGSNSTACYANYGIYPVHRPYCHEMALRIVLACIEQHAARYKRRIVPLLSLSVDFYVRIFVRVYTSPAEVKDTATRLSYLWQSSGCDSFWLQPVGQKRPQTNGGAKHLPGPGPAVESRCPDTGSGFIMGGPIWGQPIHDQAYVQGLLSDVEAAGTSVYAAATKVRGYLISVAGELPDAPLYYNLHDLCKAVRAGSPKADQFRSAIVNAGYRVSGSHANPLAVKTDAPPSVVWDIVRCWVKKNGVSAAAVKDPDSYSAKILAKEPAIEASFALAAGAMARPKDDRTPRFVHNPAYWGPKARHGRPDVTRPQQQGEQAQGEGGGAGPSGAGAGGAGGGGGGNRGKKRKGGQRGKQEAGAAEGEHKAAEGQEGKGQEAGQGEKGAGEAAVAGEAAGAGGEGDGSGAGGGDAAMAEAGAGGAGAAAGGEEPEAKRAKAEGNGTE